MKKRNQSKSHSSGEAYDLVEPLYSGSNSEMFWDVINNIGNEKDRRRLYSLGVDLQNAESALLKQLNEVIKKEYK